LLHGFNLLVGECVLRTSAEASSEASSYKKTQVRGFVMRRCVGVVCSFVFVSLPFTASALGLGDIKLDSALNQRFSAEIPLASYEEADLSGLTVQLASKETFVRYGIHLPAFLHDFEFTLVSGPSVPPVIRVTSQRPVAEPFVTMLLNIEWPSGRLLREFTVLLDPPLFETQEVQPAIAPAISESATPTPPVVAPTTSNETATAQARAASLVEQGSYNVQRRDTLWSIAERIRGDSDTTVNQVMLALYRANPDAFLGNINRLKAGVILRIPENTQREEMSPAQAAAAVREQNAAHVSLPTESAQLTLVAPGNELETERAAENAVEEPGNAADQFGAGASSDAVEEATRLQMRLSDVENELSQSRRLVEIRNAELALLQRRIAALEGADFGDVRLEEGDTADSNIQVLAPVDPIFVDEAADLAAVDETDVAGEQSAVDLVTTVPPREEAPSSFFGALLSSVWFWVSAAVVLILALFVARRRVQDEPESEHAVVGDESDDGLSSTAAAAEIDSAETLQDFELLPAQPDAPVVVDEAPDADATAQLNGLIDAPPDAGVTAELQIPDEDEVETPLEKTISTGAPLNLDQADPVAEAEFHMAYGLYDQAAELLQSALQAEPENRTYRLKLIEVFFVWENREGFMEHAQVLRDSVADETDAEWSKVVILGQQLCPDESLFSGGAAAAPTADSMDLELADAGETELDFTLAGNLVEALDEDGSLAGDDALDIDLGTNFEGEHDDLAATPETPTIESPLIMDSLESPTLEAIETLGGEDETAEILPLSEDAFADDIDFDLGGAEDLDIDLSGLSGLSGLSDAEGDDATEVFDREKDAASPDESAGGDKDDAALAVVEEVDLEDSLEAEIEAELSSQAEAADDQIESDTVEQQVFETAEEELGDTAEEPVMANSGVDLAGALDEEQEDGVSSGVEEPSLPEDITMTEVGTKLDLARAYIDMGDPEGARSILNEVLDEGGEDQQQEARQLLEELGY
jgi:pilus assembly protein FimV